MPRMVQNCDSRTFKLARSIICPLTGSIEGGQFPVYHPPAGLATIERRHNDRVWQGCLFVDARFTTDMLILLGQTKQVYLSVHELKAERRRWIRSISLESTNPAEE